MNQSHFESAYEAVCSEVEFQDFEFCFNFQGLQPIKAIERVSLNDLNFEDFEDLLE